MLRPIVPSWRFTLGDETRKTEVDHGNYDPLHATRKPSTADAVEEEAPEVAQMPETREDVERLEDET